MSMAREIWCAAAAQLHMFPVFHNNQGLAGGRYLILMDVIWFIIRASLTLSPSRLLPATALRCQMSEAPSQVSVLGAATPPHSLHCCRGRWGNIQNHAFVPTWHLNDCWSWSLLECRALHCHWGGQLPGGENWIFWAHPEQLLHHCTALPVPVEQTPQLTDICR